MRGAWFEPVTALTEAVAAYPETAIAVFTQDDHEYTVQRLARIGIKGYILKSDIISGRLDKVVERIHNGLPYFSPEVLAIIETAPALHPAHILTPRQLEILHVLIFSSDVSREEQAASLGISPSTLQGHISIILDKMGVAKVETAIVDAIRMRLVDISHPPRRPE